MKEVIFKHLNKRYEVTNYSLMTFTIFSKREKDFIGLKKFLKDCSDLFIITESEFKRFFDEWFVTETDKLNKRTAELQAKIYASGLDIELTADQADKLLSQVDSLELHPLHI